MIRTIFWWQTTANHLFDLFLQKMSLKSFSHLIKHFLGPKPQIFILMSMLMYGNQSSKIYSFSSSQQSIKAKKELLLQLSILNYFGNSFQIWLFCEPTSNGQIEDYCWVTFDRRVNIGRLINVLKISNVGGMGGPGGVYSILSPSGSLILHNNWIQTPHKDQTG